MIRTSILSALAQTLAPAEVIVVDDASDDETADVVRRVKDPRVKFVRLERNVGGAAARNVGIATARSDFVAFLDSDDWWLPTKLEFQLKRLRDSGEQVVYSLCYSARNHLAVRQRAPSHEGNLLVHLAGGWCPPTTSSFVIRRALFSRVEFDEKLLGFQDYDLWLQLASDGIRFVLVNEPLTVFVQHAGPRVTGSTINRLRALDEIHGKWNPALTAQGLGDRFDNAIERWKWLTRFGAYVRTEERDVAPLRISLLKELPHVPFDPRTKRRYAMYLLLGRAFYKARSDRFVVNNGVSLSFLRSQVPLNVS